MKKLLLSILLIMFPLIAHGAEPKGLILLNPYTSECFKNESSPKCSFCKPKIEKMKGWMPADMELGCPEGFKMVKFPLECQPLKSQECCTKGSGLIEKCENLLSNDQAKQCAFKIEISNCKLGSDWKPVDFCPSDYKWATLVDLCPSLKMEKQSQNNKTKNTQK